MGCLSGWPHSRLSCCPLVILILAVDIVVQQFPRGLIVLAGVAIAFAAAWYGLIRTGAARVLGVAIAVWRSRRPSSC